MKERFAVISLIFRYVAGLLRLLNPLIMLGTLWRERDAAWQTLLGIVWNAPPDPAEMFSVLMAWSAASFLWVFGTAPSINQVVKPMLDVAPLNVWVPFLFYMGFAQLYALLTRCWSGRRHTTFVMLMLWSFILGSTILQGKPIFAAALYFVGVVKSLWAYWRIGRLPRTNPTGLKAHETAGDSDRDDRGEARRNERE